MLNMLQIGPDSRQIYDIHEYINKNLKPSIIRVRFDELILSLLILKEFWSVKYIVLFAIFYFWLQLNDTLV